MKELKFAVATALMTASVSTLAVEGPGGKWLGEAELGVIYTHGNTKTETYNGKLGFSHEKGSLKHAINLEALRAESDGTKSAEKYFAKGKSDYKFTAKDYAFGSAEYENDKFSGYERRTTEVLGYGRNLISNDTTKLDIEAGPGARQSKLDNGDSENEWMIRALGKLEWKISKTATFTETVTADFAEEAKIYKSVSALSAQVIGALAMKVSYTIKHVSDVPVGIDKTDGEAALTLVYKF